MKRWNRIKRLCCLLLAAMLMLNGCGKIGDGKKVVLTTGFDKDEINVQLDNGYLTISAAKGLDKDEKAKDGQFIRRERYAGAMSRSFFVGEEVTREEIKAKYKNGILKLDIPKKEPENREKNSYIAIEG